jgi:hypothetical protein
MFFKDTSTRRLGFHFHFQWGISPRGEKASKSRPPLDETVGRAEHVPPVELPKGHIDYSDYTGPSRVFTKFDHPFPCFKGEPQLMLETPAHEGHTISASHEDRESVLTLTGIVLPLGAQSRQANGI